MIRSVFYRKNGLFYGFHVSGHAECGDYGHDIVCAGVSSAVMLTVNTVQEFIKADSDVLVRHNAVALKLKNPRQDSAARACVFSLMEHLKHLSGSGGINVELRDYGERNLK